MTALEIAFLKAMGAPKTTGKPTPTKIQGGWGQQPVEHSCFDYDDVSRYVDEEEWENRRASHRAYEQSRKLIPWANKEGTCDQHRDLMTTLLTEKGYTLLAHGWNSTDDGYPYYVNWYTQAVHQTLLFKAPDNAALAFMIRYAARNGEQGAQQSLSVNVVGEVNDSNASDPFQGVLSIRGFRGLSSSWGGSTTDTRWSHSKAFELHWSDPQELPDPTDLASAIQEAYQSIKKITPEAPLRSFAYFGNNADNSQEFPRSDSFVLFWERAGGYDRVLTFAPRASFTEAWVDKQGRRQY